MNINTHAHSFLPGTHKHTLPPHLVNQTVFNTNHWPVDVSALLRGISSVQTLSPNTHTHSRSHSNTHSHTQTAKDKHNQLFKTLVLAHVFFLIISVLLSL